MRAQLSSLSFNLRDRLSDQYTSRSNDWKIWSRGNEATNVQFTRLLCGGFHVVRLCPGHLLFSLLLLFATGYPMGQLLSEHIKHIHTIEYSEVIFS